MKLLDVFIEQLHVIMPEIKVHGPFEIGNRTEYRFNIEDDVFSIYDVSGDVFMDVSGSDVIYDLSKPENLEKAIDHALRYAPKENIYDFSESETGNYAPPKFVVKPYPGDKGYELVRKRYKRFIWVAPGLGKGKIDKGENSPVTEGFDFIDSYNPAEISGMGQSRDFPATKTPGYTKDTGADYLPSDYYEDPDKKKSEKLKLKRIKDFEDFINDKEK